MGEKPKSDKSDAAPVCAWCGRGLLADERQMGVCERCVQLLKNANISDDEIYGKTGEK